MTDTELNTQELIKQQIADYPIILYMKGTPERPCCGFSAKVVHILSQCHITFAHVNVLEHPDIRRELPHYSQWPTFPQLYYQRELIGGCDIVEQLYQSGELQKKLSKT